MNQPKTLPDYLAHDLDVVVIGLNPSPASIRQGYYYGHPRNRFWPALRASGLIPASCEPGPATLAYLRDAWRIGFTDIVKRPTPGAASLRAADYRGGAPRLEQKLQNYQPLIAWFNGKGVYENFLRHAVGRSPVPAIEWGEQQEPVAGCVVPFVTPNPSPANAAFRLDDLIEWYRGLREMRDRLRST